MNKTEKQLIMAVSGVKNSGKTTLITLLLPELKKLGLQAAVIKHDGHEFDADIPETDTWKFAQAGACGTLVFSESKFMMVKYMPAPSSEELVEFFPEADVIFLEGFKYSQYPKIEIVRKGNSRDSVCNPEQLLGIVTDFESRKLKNSYGGKEGPLPETMKFFGLNDIADIAKWIWDLYQVEDR